MVPVPILQNRRDGISPSRGRHHLRVCVPSPGGLSCAQGRPSPSWFSRRSRSRRPPARPSRRPWHLARMLVIGFRRRSSIARRWRCSSPRPTSRASRAGAWPYKSDNFGLVNRQGISDASLVQAIGAMAVSVQQGGLLTLFDQSGDVAKVQQAGHITATSPGTFEVSASGANIWGASDEFYFASKTRHGGCGAGGRRRVRRFSDTERRGEGCASSAPQGGLDDTRLARAGCAVCGRHGARRQQSRLLDGRPVDRAQLRRAWRIARARRGRGGRAASRADGADAFLLARVVSRRPDARLRRAAGREFDIFTVPVEGGVERRFTNANGLDDGPDDTQDGQWIQARRTLISAGRTCSFRTRMEARVLALARAHHG